MLVFFVLFCILLIFGKGNIFFWNILFFNKIIIHMSFVACGWHVLPGAVVPLGGKTKSHNLCFAVWCFWRLWRLYI